jgi:cyclopropane fatty-acyl-phospholipid synthase-like methyltransferase
MSSQIDNVRKYYESTVLDYWEFWTGTQDLAMHLGYYDDTITTHAHSLLKMNAILADYASVSSRDRVLDAGCGYGGSAIWLARNIGCEVMGIDVVPHQLAEANKFADSYQVSDKVGFRLEDFTSTSFADGSFDVVWAVESVGHAENKEQFIAEACRLLHGGGRILISEIVLSDNPSLTPEKEDILMPYRRGWAIPNMLTSGQYTSLLERIGFKAVQTYDLTDNIRLSVNRLGQLSREALPRVRRSFRSKAWDKNRFANVLACASFESALQLGLWRYIVVVGRRGDEHTGRSTEGEPSGSTSADGGKFFSRHVRSCNPPSLGSLFS